MIKITIFSIKTHFAFGDTFQAQKYVSAAIFIESKNLLLLESFQYCKYLQSNCTPIFLKFSFIC